MNDRTDDAAAVTEQTVAQRLIETLARSNWRDRDERARVYDALERIMARNQERGAPDARAVRDVVRTIDALVGHFDRIPTLREYVDLTQRLRAAQREKEAARARAAAAPVEVDQPPAPPRFEPARAPAFAPAPAEPPPVEPTPAEPPTLAPAPSQRGASWPMVALLGLFVLGVCGAVAVWPSLLGRGHGLADCGPQDRNCFDSGWVAVSNARADRLRLSHGLGDVPRVMTVWFRVSAVDPQIHQMARGGSETNPVSIVANATHVELTIAPAQPFVRWFDPANGAWLALGEGQVRVIGLR